jgi:ABC-2 type transport system ATP-binding protein
MVTTHYMDEAELCQRVGFINQGKLVALDTPGQLKQTQMRGHVLEIDCDDSEAAMRVLLAIKEGGTLPLDEVALYGAQIHAVVPDAESFKQPVWDLLLGKGIRVNDVVWIAPTLEDVFISSVRNHVNGEE